MIETAVADVMTRPARTIEATATAEAAARSFVDHAIGSLIVVDADTDRTNDGRDDGDEAGGIAAEAVRGIVAEFDVVALVAEGMATDTPLSAVMSSPVVTTAASESVETAAGCMKAEDVKKLPVVEDGRLVGIVTTTDLTYYIPRYRLDVGRRR